MESGRVLQSRYQIVGTLGAGGQGTVYEAIDRRLGIRVAVKRSIEQRDELRQAFVREARLLASLRHPSLPIVSDFFVDTAGLDPASLDPLGVDRTGPARTDVEQDGQYLVMELVPGEDLETWIARQRRPCAVDVVLRWADQLLDALAYLHRQQPPILHRDIKPRNLKLRPDGRIVLLDFGLAKGRPLQDESIGPVLSLSGYSHGYAPPEQMFKQGTDPRTDLYGVGATLYFLLTGSTPPGAVEREASRGVRHDPLRPVEQVNAEVPGQVAGLVHRALELAAERRFQTADEMRRAFATARRALRQPPGSKSRREPRPADDLSDVPTLVRMRPSQATASVSDHPAPPAADPAASRPLPSGPVPEPPSPAPAWPDDDHPTGDAARPPVGREDPRTASREFPAPDFSQLGPDGEPIPADGDIAPDPDRAADIDRFAGRADLPPGAPAGPHDAPAGPAGGAPPISGGGPGVAARREPSFLVLAHGDQALDRWPIHPDRGPDHPISLGRAAAPDDPPDIDLWPDRRVSRMHARLWHADGRWWVEDGPSKHGTFVDGRRLDKGRRVMVRPWSEIRIGATTLFLAPPGWRRLRARDLAIDLDVVGAVSSSLAHAELPVVRRVVARNRATAARAAGRLGLSLEPCIEPVSVAIPPLDVGASAVVPLPKLAARYDVLEGQIERSRRRLTVQVDGEVPRGDPIDCWLLPHNEWSTLPSHQRALATFVQPNHPAVAGICMDVASTAGADATAARVLDCLFGVLATRWQLAYRLEPPHWAADSQKIRLPHQILLDDAARRGEGTCLDLALLIAACLENLGLQPLVAVLDLGEWWHALVGCWDPPEPALEPLRFDVDRLRTGSLWLDPTAVTRDAGVARSLAAARQEAERCFRERRLIFALDVAAARQERIAPLPFAGQPTWSPGSVRAIEAARAGAEAAGSQLCSAALLAGLLIGEHQLTRRLVAHAFGNPDHAARTIVASLPPAPPGSGPSDGYRHILSMARERAKDAGSPTVLEAHLLSALLAVRSPSLDHALRELGGDQQRLIVALRTLDGGADGSQSGVLFSSWR